MHAPRRLLHDAAAVDASLGFWSGRLRGGAHARLLLLGQGPVSFAADVLAALRRNLGRLSATEQIERKVGGPATLYTHGRVGIWICVKAGLLYLWHVQQEPPDQLHGPAWDLCSQRPA